MDSNNSKFSIIEKHRSKALGYAAFREKTFARIADQEAMKEYEQRGLSEYLKLNEARISRLEKTFHPSEEMFQVMSSIKRKQLWVIVTEDWCGDSSQNTPIIEKIARLNPEHIEFIVFERDENPEVMDLYLTNGTKSIPMMAGFDVETGKELFVWGPRPQVIQDLVVEWKNQGKTKDVFLPEVQKWYSTDRGESLQRELIEKLTTTYV